MAKAISQQKKKYPILIYNRISHHHDKHGAEKQIWKCSLRTGGKYRERLYTSLVPTDGTDTVVYGEVGTPNHDPIAIENIKARHKIQHLAFNSTEYTSLVVAKITSTMLGAGRG